MDPVIGNRVRRRFLDGWMRSKTKIVLRCEVHSPKTAAGVILRGTNSLWRLIRRLGIGPVSISPAEILPRVEIFHAFEKILAVRVAVLAQAPGQRVQRHNLVHVLAHEFPHIVIDGLAHNCLQDGALAATRNVYLHGHLNLQSTRRHLKRIRARDKDNGILVVTEGLFSMDSDTPDIGAMQDLCREFNATLMVDIAHDFGNIGEDGRGHIGLQQMTGKVDIVMGSFSKTFASNGGFVSCNSPAVKEYLRYFGSSGTFSNALSPIQSAIVLKAFEIVRSEEGRTLRADLMKNVLYLRDQLKAAGLEVVGDPSAIVSVKVGDEGLARLVSQRLPRLGAIANLVEFPAVAKGSARFRLQVMAKHSKDNIDRLLAALLGAIEAAQQSPRYYRTLMPTEETTTAFPSSSEVPARARAVGE